MKKLSLRFKLYALVITLLLVMGISIVVTAQLSLGQMEQRITSETRDTVRSLAVDRLSATAGKYGEVVSGMFATAYRTPEVVRNVISRNIQTDSSGRISRVALQETVGAVLEEQDGLSSIYAQFEPDAYDGQDRYFTGGVEEHSSDEGTLEIYYYRSPDGDVVFSRTEDPATKYLDNRNEFGIREAEWYLCSKDTLSPCIMEPYEYEIEEGYTELMTSLVVPIMNGSEFAGVAGVDLNLSTLQKAIQNVSDNLYDGASRVTLLSSKGLIAASSHYSEHLGRPLSEALPEQAETYASLHNDGGTYDDGDTLAVSYPIEIDLPDAQWSLLIELPRQTALADVAEITGLLSSEVDTTAGRQTMVGVLVSVVAILILVVLVRSVTKPLNEIRDRMKNLASAEGDLTSELNIDTHSELIELAGGFNQFLGRLREMINDLKDVNAKVSQQAADVDVIAKETDEQTESQHQDIESVVTAMNEMSAAASEVAGFAGEAAENAQMAQDGIRFTQDTLTSALDGVGALAGDMDEASTAIGQVATRSEDINRIIEVIRGIAEQTNLLALNAAIEAARAGEQGRGFAVVADEVRTLASRTRESTDEISQMIDGLQSDVGGAVTVIKGGVDRATRAVEGTREADHSLASVVERIATIVEHVTHVATAAEEQSSVSEEINRNLTRIGDAANDLRALAQRVSGSGQTLDEQVKVLETELSRLKT
ncbi:MULTISPECIES: methyl-accepting chemotaxis protein [Marinobacter]|uniref:Methyl-accepting chemotaxis sensory transducer with Cache sensor n=1 Tax=Marinobacter salarius TaxID=1420917 RepID=A0ABY1FSS6_9GAMM|nr:MULTISPECIES: methyl-accepting chemotaxis protein [Marinobacter]KXJ43392.1 MAG: chemotaxis protein [Marinobacter sp. Hex_13]MBJ7300453.1 methyl-accepting chemotaxis protein [Marinobacter salarius]MBS8229869.1 methyl-accepting chemotaxis protein [Marinobacter salarius]MCZ4286389.1 methyl-accepting chemotaxis protein [Marinobacter salarius]MDP4534520.1 methyl-accepting chemotaxis protein [Marinobacter salarius]